MIRNFLNSRGFTLVEVLASVVLLAVVLTISLSIFPNMFRTNDVNQESLNAVTVAKDVLVNLKSNKNGNYISKDQFIVADVDDPAPEDNYFTWIEDYNETTNPNPKYKGYKVLIIIDHEQEKSGTDDSSIGLDLYKTTIKVFEGQNVRATTYGYVTGADFK